MGELTRRDPSALAVGPRRQSVAVNDIFRVVITAQQGTHFFQNTYAVKQELVSDVDTTHFAAFVGDAITMWKNRQTAQCIYVTWSATQLWGQGMTIVQSECRREGGLQFGDLITGQLGLESGDPLPPQNAAVLTIATGQTGKRKRGRIYAFGQVEANQVGGLWTSSYLTGQNSACTTFFNLYKAPSGTSPNFTLGVWSERTASGCVPATPPQKGHVNVDTAHPELAFTPATGFNLRQVVYTQRRRTVGVGY